MSVDVTLEADCCGIHDHQFTYNYTPALREAGFPSWKYFEGLPGWVLRSFIERVLLELQTRAQVLTEFIRGGGEWGTITSLCEQLEALASTCEKHPQAAVRIT
jgi:hypothetical protein